MWIIIKIKNGVNIIVSCLPFYRRIYIETLKVKHEWKNKKCIYITKNKKGILLIKNKFQKGSISLDLLCFMFEKKSETLCKRFDIISNTY